MPPLQPIAAEGLLEMTSHIVTIARVQTAKLRRRKMIWLFGVAPFVLSLMVVAPALIALSRPEFEDAGVDALFNWGLIIGWGGFLSWAGRMFALILGATAIDRDLRDGTIFPVLAKPASRAQVILGKLLGSATVVGVYLAMEALILLVAAAAGGSDVEWGYLLTALLADAFAFLAMLSLGLLLGMVMRPALGIGIAILGGILLNITSYMIHSSSTAWQWIGGLLIGTLPRAGEMTAWLNTSEAAQLDPVPVAMRLGYALAWGALLTVGALWRFQRRELTR